MSQRQWMCSIAALVALGASTTAQFQGDVFFKDPSVVVGAGGTVVMEVQTFVGADPLGGVAFQLRFDRKQLAVVKVEAGATREAQTFRALDRGDRYVVVALNAESKAEPIGTVSVAKFTFRALAPSGTKVGVQLESRAMVTAASVPFAKTKGFAGELTVTASGSRSEKANGPAEKVRITSWEELGVWQPLRRLGSTVRRFVGSWGESGHRVRLQQVQSVDPAAPRDR